MDKQNITVSLIRSLIDQVRKAERRFDLANKFHRGYDFAAGRYVAGRISSERYDAALRAVSSARAQLDHLVLTAAWGRQDNGRVFVQDRSGAPYNYGVRYITINVDGLAVLSGEIRESRESGEDEAWNVEIHDIAKERARREAQRAAAREHEVKQATQRARIADDLRRGRVPRDVEAVDGQRGGYLVVGRRTKTTWRGSLAPWAGYDYTETTNEGITLAIRGVLKAAGIDPGDDPYMAWIETIADMSRREPAAQVRARQLPPRVRYMRAAEVRA